MIDIHPIKNLIYILHYLKIETWYMLGIGLIVYLIYIAYLIAFERYYKTQHSIQDSVPQKKSFLDTLQNLQVDDIHFFERLSFLIRSHLEDSRQVPLATKKTPRDFRGESIAREFKEVLDICTHYEYAGEEANREKKIELINRLRGCV